MCAYSISLKVFLLGSYVYGLNKELKLCIEYILLILLKFLY